VVPAGRLTVRNDIHHAAGRRTSAPYAVRIDHG
jgi:hypothetical protein